MPMLWLLWLLLCFVIATSLLLQVNLGKDVLLVVLGGIVGALMTSWNGTIMRSLGSTSKTKKSQKITKKSPKKLQKNPPKKYANILANNILRLFWRTEYNLALLGKGNIFKEMLELSAVHYYLMHTLADLFFPTIEDPFKRFGQIGTVCQNPNIVCIIPGDGILPRAGYLFAKLCPDWTVISIDPIMDADRANSEYALKNLHCVKDSAENVDIKTYMPTSIEDPIFILLHIHSHANFAHGWQRLQSISPKGKKIGLSMPCCGKLSLHILPEEIKPLKQVVDEELAAVTPKAEIYIYAEGFCQPDKTPEPLC